MKRKSGILALSLVLAASVQASVITNYYDNFDGASDVRLHGTTPDITIGANTWTARNLEIAPTRNPMADGSFLGGTSGQGGGVLPFTIEAGKVYTFTLNATISNPDAGAAGTDWLGLAFKTSGANINNITADDFAMMRLGRDGVLAATTKGGTAGTTSGTGTAQPKRCRSYSRPREPTGRRNSWWAARPSLQTTSVRRSAK